MQITEQPAVQAWKPRFKMQKENLDQDKNDQILEGERKLRQVLNRVSEGNVDPMFQQL